MSSIVTFYSYKGGVGRSMALANIAVLLARRGLKVLAVDWDLEAPGLERYFGSFKKTTAGLGLLRMFMEASGPDSLDMASFTSSFDCDSSHPITLLASGREQDEEYSKNLESFRWEDFFLRGGGDFIEGLRSQWRAEYDIVLIDSRTGLSDSGGICTIQIPDIVVAMFTANHQSLYGVRDVMRLAQRARQALAYDRMPLAVIPLPSRWGVQEFQQTQTWLDNISDAMQEFYDDWLPKTLSVREVVQGVKIPQSDYFGFGEKLAVVEQGTSDPTGMGFVYEKIASFLASNMYDVSSLVGERAMHKAANPIGMSKATNSVGVSFTPPAVQDYLYDVFVSYHHSSADWALEFSRDLKQAMAEVGDSVPRIFVAIREVRVGTGWDEEITQAIERSKVMVALLTPEYVAAEWSRLELEAFSSRSRITRKILLAPVLLRDVEIPEAAREFSVLDFRRMFRKFPYSSRARAPRSEMMLLAETLVKMIAEVPPLDYSSFSKPPTIALGPAARTAYQLLYDKNEQAIQATMDVTLLEALHGTQLDVRNILTKDSMYRLHASTALYNAVINQMNLTNKDLEDLRKRIAAGFIDFPFSKDVVDAIDKVLQAVPVA